MPAPLDNKNAVGNDGGRPPIYDITNKEDVSKLQNLCEEYFEYIKGEFQDDEFEYEPGKFTTKKEWIRNPEPPTVTGLTLHLGFESKSTLYDYAKKVEFSHSIKRALTRIEQFHEIATSMGDKCTGNIFVLKNFGWKDTSNTDITTNGETINTNPSAINIRIVENSDDEE